MYLQKHGELHMGPCYIETSCFSETVETSTYNCMVSSIRAHARLQEVLLMLSDVNVFAEAWRAPYGPMLSEK